jgi:hypothetical protein
MLLRHFPPLGSTSLDALLLLWLTLLTACFDHPDPFIARGRKPSPNRSEPEDLIHDFMTLTGIKAGHIRADGAGEFARIATFKSYGKRHNIVIEEVPAYTHTFNA